MKLPAITVPQASLMNVLASFAAMANVKAGLGVNMLASASASAVASATARLDLNAMAALKLAASANASTRRVLRFSLRGRFGQCLSEHGREGRCHAQRRKSAAKLSSLSNLMALAASMIALGVPVPTSPCSVCKFIKPACRHLKRFVGSA